MTPAQFKEWIDTLRDLLPSHQSLIYKLTTVGGIITLLAGNFAPEETRQVWMNVGAAIGMVGAQLGSSPAKPRDGGQ